MRTVLVFVVLPAVAVLVAACATTGQVEDLEARIEDLEAAAEVAATTTTAPASRDISGTLSTFKVRTLCKYKTTFIFEGDRTEPGSGVVVTARFVSAEDRDRCRTAAIAEAE